MQRVIVVCDKCGEELQGEFSHVELSDAEFDLCEKCDKEMENEIKNWIKKATKSSVVEQDEKKKEQGRAELKAIFEKSDSENFPTYAGTEGILGKKSKKVDWDKAVELKRSGMRTKEIAQILGCNEGTLIASLYKHMKG